MSWFGWLTKPALEVSALDSFIMIAEVIGAFIVGAVLFVWFSAMREMVRDWKNRRRRPMP